MRKRLLQMLGILLFLAVLMVLGVHRQQRDRLEASDSFYEKLSDGFDVHILVVGDSISAGSGASDEAHRWVTMLQNYLEETYHVKVLVNNVSLGGNTSYAGYVRTRNLQDGDLYDLVILCFAQNDPPGELAFYYECLVRAVEQMCPHASMISIKESTLRKEKHRPKVEALERVSAHYEIPVADMVRAYQASAYSYEQLSEDLIHPSDEGQKIYFETLREMIAQGVSEGWKETAPHSPLQEEVLPFDRFRYYPAQQFERTDACTYRIKNMEDAGTAGLDYFSAQGEHALVIRVNGKDVWQQDLSYKSAMDMRYIKVLSTEMQLQGEVELQFSDEEAAEQFLGLVVSGSQDESHNFSGS